MEYDTFTFSARTLLVVQQERHPTCNKWVLVCWWWWFDWSYAGLTAPIVIITSAPIKYSGTGLKVIIKRVLCHHLYSDRGKVICRKSIAAILNFVWFSLIIPLPHAAVKFRLVCHSDAGLPRLSSKLAAKTSVIVVVLIVVWNIFAVYYCILYANWLFIPV